MVEWTSSKARSGSREVISAGEFQGEKVGDISKSWRWLTGALLNSPPLRQGDESARRAAAKVEPKRRRRSICPLAVTVIMWDVIA